MVKQQEMTARVLRMTEISEEMKTLHRDVDKCIARLDLLRELSLNERERRGILEGQFGRLQAELNELALSDEPPRHGVTPTNTVGD